MRAAHGGNGARELERGRDRCADTGEHEQREHGGRGGDERGGGDEGGGGEGGDDERGDAEVETAGW